MGAAVASQMDDVAGGFGALGTSALRSCDGEDPLTGERSTLVTLLEGFLALDMDEDVVSGV